MLTLKVTEERVNEMPFSIYRQVGKDPDYMARFIAHFAYDEPKAKYLSTKEALAQMDELTLGEIGELVETIRGQADEVVAPKA